MIWHDPNDIETVEVLKGSAAAAIYGSKASSGVVLITTKRGAPGGLRWTVSEGLGTSRLAHRNGHRIWSYEDAVAFYGVPAAQYFDSVSHRAKVELDYEDLAYGARPVNSDLSLSVSGGSADTRFFLSGAGRDEGGMVANTGAKKYSDADDKLNCRMIEDTDDNEVIENGSHMVVGGTAWLFSRKEMRILMVSI